MPYLPDARREEFRKALDQLPNIERTGELGFVLQQVIDQYLFYAASQDDAGELRYTYQGNVFGAIMSVMFDFYGCVFSQYERDVRARYGEVWSSAHRLPGHQPRPPAQDTNRK